MMASFRAVAVRHHAIGGDHPLGRAALGFANASCAHCIRVVTRSLQKVDGVESVEIDPVGQRVLIGFDPTRVSIDAIRQRMEGAGYPTRLLA